VITPRQNPRVPLACGLWARLAVALAAGATLATLAVPVAWAKRSSASPTPAATVTSSAPGTGSAGVPKLGSRAAAMIGGPLMASSGTVVAQHALPLPKIPASAWVIANADTGQVLAAKDPHGEFAPASTLKVLTAITLVPLLNPDGTVVASKLAASQEENDVGLIAGRSYQVSDLFHALLLISANDAAVALTEATGSFTTGMALINAEARNLQAYDVDAQLPNGLPAAGQVVSAYDEALIARQALSLPDFMRYDEMLTSKFEIKPRDWVTLVNQNTLLTKYKGGIGGKIGWTVSSEATYIGMARRDGVTLIATVLHCTALQEITAAEQLLTWGFAMNGKVTPVGTLVSPLVVATAAHGRRMAPSGDANPPQPNPVASPASYALLATGVIVAGLGLSSLARTRRRIVDVRQHPQSSQSSPGPQ
jgi:serine-type D-Ala-D-Ala carboxypeptidase (penicillin-binding protein 5/6)